MPFKKILAKQNVLASAHKHLLETMRDTYYRASAAGIVEFVSKSSQHVLGFSPEELIGTRIVDFYEDPKDREGLLEKLLENGGALDGYFFWGRHKNGDRIALETNLHIVRDQDNEIAGFEGIVRNITDRVKTEAQNTELGRVVEEAPAEILIFDAETLALVIVNLAARTNLGYSMKELHQMRLSSIKPKDTGVDMDEFLTSLACGEETVIKFESLLRRKDGTEYPIDVSLQYSGNPPH